MVTNDQSPQPRDLRILHHGIYHSMISMISVFLPFLTYIVCLLGITAADTLPPTRIF